MKSGHGINFIRSLGQAVDYREDHRGIPLKIVIFMSICRALAFYLIALPPLFILAFMQFGWVVGVWWFVTSIYFGISTNNRLDIFTPFGFHLFRGFITVRK